MATKEELWQREAPGEKNQSFRIIFFMIPSAAAARKAE
jgi:hypothetical protein